MKRTDMIRLSPAAIFCAILAAFAVFEIPVAMRILSTGKPKSIEKRLLEIREACARKIPLRMDFVTLNGGVTRLLGQHCCNDSVKMKPGGYLIHPSGSRADMTQNVKSAASFSRWCAKRGIRYLYIMLPKNLDVRQTMLPPGAEDRAYANADEFLEKAAARRVAVRDWRAAFAATPEMVLDNFYRTDHHWNNDASFKATAMLLDEICAQCDVPPDKATAARALLAEDSWTREIMPACFLGSQGWRTGALFSGLDDMIVRRPRFKTGNMSIHIPSENVRRTGTFEETAMWRAGELKEPGRGIKEKGAYSLLYTGGLYPQIQHANQDAPIDRRVLLIGDSYLRPVEAFLSVAVKKVDVVDLRRCDRRFRLSRHVKETKPDIVIQILAPSSLTSDTIGIRKIGRAAMFDYGLSNGK